MYAQRITTWVLLFVVSWHLAISHAATADELVFTDITSTLGVEMTSLLVESVAWGDYDNDNDPDLYLTADGANRLYRNDGGGTFTDVTATAGVGNALWGVGTSFGDLDNDGDLDLYVVNFGAGIDALYRNDGPTGAGNTYVFSDVTMGSGTTESRSSRGMTFVDFDRDGLLDIYVNAIGDDLLYRNLGNLQFENVAGDVGITGVGGLGVGVTATDVNNDGWVDIFTGNRSSDPNRLFLNHGGSFTDISGNGIDQVGLGMGVIALDYDNDLDTDLYWTTWPGEENALYVNAGGTLPTFTDAAAASGTLDSLGWGISANAADVDNDGWLDFFVTNGFTDASTANVLFRNNGDGTFEDASGALAGGGLFDGRGVGFADFDGDGDMDMIVTSDAGEPNRLWRNDSTNTNHFMAIELAGMQSNRNGIGARVKVNTDAGGRVQELISAAGRGSANDLQLIFGLANQDTVNSIAIRWPNGQFQVVRGLSVDQLHTIVESAGADVDLNDDGFVDEQDVDALTLEIAAGSLDLAFDLDDDGVVGMGDLQLWLADAAAFNLTSGNAYLGGDANLDGFVDAGDFNAWNKNKFGAAAAFAWSDGDFNADGIVDVRDFNIWNVNKFSSSLDTVPEPHGLGMLLCVALIGIAVRRTRNRT